MIDRDSWFDFIRGFLGVSATNDWLGHVVRNWNSIRKQPGCDCSWTFEEKPQYKFCQDYLDILDSRRLEE